jgi:hypothetical protein
MSIARPPIPTFPRKGGRGFDWRLLNSPSPLAGEEWGGGLSQRPYRGN